MEQYLFKGAEQLDISLSLDQVRQFIKFYNLIVLGNQACNLTAITAQQDVVVRHFLDSLSCVKAVSFDGDLRFIDVGTGAGFPGIPLKIMYPRLSVVLIESINKKVNFLKNTVKELGLNNIDVAQLRAEEAGTLIDFRERFDRVTARAVAQLNILAEYCLPLVKIGGYFIALKGPSMEDELYRAIPAIEKLGGLIENNVKIRLPYTEEGRTLIAIRKIRNTPKMYPRRIGLPAKKPL
ncbi:methyltransferase GidB [Desulfofarcimen acetoxidans DSM 771]|uniref:Ribosomal RNA small subunit methyltransferase G n=1 Tax=Desulfofarcimen acetoxidans (strain ATCC 49208 / DSM 771 / KCTC 5769 / VKM B-1644 / 5575) TaxID=485916 RepID=C8W058_DESAS|nr:16S rRNA (guanine(527)-N(7))-methyltransferase RsmG [Desulfofarcimen acetoxidans]ACV65026.1 methyltransferase GidB [Desulfofarcimen acetoxidans DSM 771]